MNIKFNTDSRKNLANAIAAKFGVTAAYCGAPSFAYTAGPATIHRDGTVSFPESMTDDELCELLNTLKDEGYSFERPEPEQGFGLTVTIQRKDTDDGWIENLHALVASKRTLLCKALELDALPIQVTETAVSFPWFHRELSVEEIHAYTELIAALFRRAMEQKRVTASEKPTDNDKYTFRCFLLRLGFVGDEYKADRKILLRNLSGTASFRDGSK